MLIAPCFNGFWLKNTKRALVGTVYTYTKRDPNVHSGLNFKPYGANV